MAFVQVENQDMAEAAASVASRQNELANPPINFIEVIIVADRRENLEHDCCGSSATGSMEDLRRKHDSGRSQEYC